MKKLGKFLVVGAVAATVALGTVGFAACGNSATTAEYKGEYKYVSPYNENQYYGVKVTVTIQDVTKKVEGVTGIVDGTIKKVTCEADTENYFNFTASSSWSGHDAGIAQLNDYLKTFEGMSVVELSTMIGSGTLNIEIDEETVWVEEYGYYSSVAGQPTSVTGMDVMTGATQSSARIILAVLTAIAAPADDNQGYAEDCWMYHMIQENSKLLEG